MTLINYHSIAEPERITTETNHTKAAPQSVLQTSLALLPCYDYTRDELRQNTHPGSRSTSLSAPVPNNRRHP